MKEQKYGGYMGWLLLSLQVLLLGLTLVVGFQSRQGWSTSNVLLVLCALALLLLVFLQCRRGGQLQRVLAARAEELSLLRADYDALVARVERGKLARERVEQAREQGVRQAEAVRRGLVGETRGALLDSLFRAFSAEQELVQGIYYSPDDTGGYRLGQTFALYSDSGLLSTFRRGETLVGQVALEGKPLYLDDIPPDYRVIVSGLGRSAPRRMLIWPLLGAGGRDLGVLELAFFTPHSTWSREMLDEVMDDFTRRMDELSA